MALPAIVVKAKDVLSKAQKVRQVKNAVQSSNSEESPSFFRKMFLIGAGLVFVIMFLLLLPIFTVSSFAAMFELQAVDPNFSDEYANSTATRINSICANPNGTTRVLFVGNSRTYKGDIPGKVKAIAESNGYSLDYKEALRGGATLDSLASDYSGVLTGQEYDCVVMQEQSDTYISNYDVFLSGAKNVVNTVKSTSPNAKTYVRQTWAKRGSSRSTIDKAYKNAEDVANETNSFLIYDGKAFDEVLSKYSDISLYQDDIHQSSEGAYLSALCIYERLYGKDPNGTKYTAGLSEDVAQRLQKAAYDSAPELISTIEVAGGVDLNYDYEKLYSDSQNAPSSPSSPSSDLARTSYSSVSGFNKHIKDCVSAAGYGTRAGVVAAGKCLISDYIESTGKRLRYSMPNRGSSEMEGILDNTYFDCSSFAWWALYNGGFKLPCYNTTPNQLSWALNYGVATKEYQKAQAGDFLIYDNGGGANGHARLIIGTYSDGVYIAEFSSGGQISKTPFNAISGEYYLVQMEKYYSDSSNRR